MATPRNAAKALAALVAISSLALTSCSSSSSGPSADAPGSGETYTQEQIDEAMTTPTTIDLWAWVEVQDQVDLFEAKYPDIKVNIVNNGGATQQYVKYRAALEAGKGVPDVVQVGYDRISSFNQTESLLDLTPLGAADISSQFVPGIWSQVESNGGVWAIPQDSGPMGTLYRTDLFQQAGVELPATWDDFAVAAEKLKASTGSYITNLPGNDMPQMLGFFSQAGTSPWSYDGKETVGIDIDNEVTQEVVGYWEKLVQADLVGVDPDYTDGWYQGLARGQYASWLTAAWGPTFLQGTAGETSGLWAAGDLPQWDASERVSANWGGSANAVSAESDSPIAAYKLAEFINTDPASTVSLANDLFLFPTTVATLEDPAFADKEAEFYGGQKVNAFFADVSSTVAENQQWLPFMDYVNSAYDETLGKAIAERGDMLGALTAWQDKVAEYAEQQGFTVN